MDVMRTYAFESNSLSCLFALFGALLVPLIVPAAPPQLVSRPVGVFVVELAPLSQRLLSMPLKPLDSDIHALFANQLVGAASEDKADTICKWNAQSQTYEGAYKADNTDDPAQNGQYFADFATWTPARLMLDAGEGFWVRNAQAVTQTVFLCGEVVLDPMHAIRLAPGYNLIGNPFAAPIRLNETTLAADGAWGAMIPAEADGVIDATALRNYWLADKGTKLPGQWVGLSSVATEDFLAKEDESDRDDPTLLPGRGYLYRRAPLEAFDWMATCPYDNPFPADGGVPKVVGMTLNPESDALTLTVAASGAPGELLEIYYQDDGVWRVAATGLASGGQKCVAWTDAGTADRPCIASVSTRFYLVGRGDIDSDGDGIPDAREIFVNGTYPMFAKPTALEPGGCATGQGAGSLEQKKNVKEPDLADSNTVVIAETYLYLDPTQMGKMNTHSASASCLVNIKIPKKGPVTQNGIVGGGRRWLESEKAAMTGGWIRLRVEQNNSDGTSNLAVKKVAQPIQSGINDRAVIQWSLQFDR